MAETERRVALVTGGSRGIGAATTLALATRGYDVALTYRNKVARAERVAAEARARGVGALPIGGDMTRPADLARLLAELHAWRGALDALILNASGGLEREALASD
ncbi:MAG TPA: SDR family NAD(P)-dependent oxidoreductase, partial [Ktedonobacterales bacterium]